MPGFNSAKFVFDNQPVGVVMKDATDPTPVEVASFGAITPDHYEFNPGQDFNTYERGDGSQGGWRTGDRGELVLTVSEQDPDQLDSIREDTRTIEVTNLKTGAVVTLTVDYGSTYVKQANGEAEIHFHISNAIGDNMADLVPVVRT